MDLKSRRNHENHFESLGGGSLCDRIVAVERKVGSAIESGEAASTGAITELSAALAAHVEEAKSDSSNISLRLDALEGVFEGGMA